MLEQLIEQKTITALAALNLAHAQLFGAWQAAATGEVKTEGDKSLALIDVNAKPRSYDSFGMPDCDISVDITVRLRDELCPTGAEVASYCDPIFTLIHSWQKSLAAVRSAFAIQNFIVAGFRTDGGDVVRDGANNCSVVTQSFTIKGVIS